MIGETREGRVHAIERVYRRNVSLVVVGVLQVVFRRQVQVKTNRREITKPHAGVVESEGLQVGIGLLRNTAGVVRRIRCSGKV